MKRAAVCTAIISILIFVIVWGVIGLNIMNSEYNVVTPLTCVGLGCLIVFFISLIVLRWGSWKCPNCGKPRWTNGRYCSYCGKEI